MDIYINSMTLSNEAWIQVLCIVAIGFIFIIYKGYKNKNVKTNEKRNLLTKNN